MIRSNFKKLTESDIVGRIMLLSNKKLDDAVKGYQLLRSEGRLDNFVDPQTDGKFLAMLEKYPNLKELIERIDAVPGKMEHKIEVKILPDPKVQPVKATNLKNLIDRLNLPDF
jgi:hypothetical protein